MTKSQIDFILDKLGITEMPSPLLQIKSIVVSKEELLFSDINLYRYYFDDNDEVLYRIPVRLFWQAQEGEAKKYPTRKYDEIFDVDTGVYSIYEYYTDSEGNDIADIYPYEAISVINAKKDIYEGGLEEWRAQL